MKSILLVLGFLVIGLSAQAQEFPVDGKKGDIVYKGAKRDTAKIEYDLKPKVKEWLKTNLQGKSKNFVYVPDKNMYTGTVYTVLKYKDKLGKEQKFPLYFTMNIHLVESALLKETTYKYELVDFDILGKKRKYYPAERLLLKGEDEDKDNLPAEHLHDLKTQAVTFIETLLADFHQSMLSGLASR
ncbi:hypothetical protein [Rufibacter sp. LB8]|uniref:hypothetical protein n=1 Tax=Rufibacter sp. LB8 TaxID=2777781 RepID=UPI00178C21DE|nr:hypothetical protein [Rufibacter sp. LB8]